MEPNVRTRQVLDEPGFVAYETMIDVYPDVVAGGILLFPQRTLKPGEMQPNRRLPARSGGGADGYDFQG